jgi:predicted DNA-binding protein (UPF0251 family)
VSDLPGTTYFKPRGIPMVDLGEVALAVDEFEALRLADLEGLYQDEAAIQMHVSRATFGRILASAHAKVAEALIHGKAIRIEGGRVTTEPMRAFKCHDCEHTWRAPFGTGRPTTCPECGGTYLHRADAGRGQCADHRRLGGRRRRGNSADTDKETL